jgi:hypothetical protein
MFVAGRLSYTEEFLTRKNVTFTFTYFLQCGRFCVIVELDAATPNFMETTQMDVIK